MKKEYAILLRVANDPNIVQFFGACLCNPPMICMEYMEVRPPLPAHPLELNHWTSSSNHLRRQIPHL